MSYLCTWKCSYQEGIRWEDFEAHEMWRGTWSWSLLPHLIPRDEILFPKLCLIYKYVFRGTLACCRRILYFEILHAPVEHNQTFVRSKFSLDVLPAAFVLEPNTAFKSGALGMWYHRGTKEMYGYCLGNVLKKYLCLEYFMRRYEKALAQVFLSKNVPLKKGLHGPFNDGYLTMRLYLQRPLL